MTRLLSESWKSSRRRLAAASTKSSTLALLAALSLLVSCVVSSGLLDDAVNVRAVKTFWAISLARERRNDYQGASAAVSAALAEALRYESSEEGGGFLLEGAIKDVAQNDTAIKRIMDEFEKETSRRLHGGEGAGSIEYDDLDLDDDDILDEEDAASSSEAAAGAAVDDGSDPNFDRSTTLVTLFTSLCRLEAIRGFMPLAFSACNSAVRLATAVNNGADASLVQKETAGSAFNQHGEILERFGEWDSAVTFRTAAAELLGGSGGGSKTGVATRLAEVHAGIGRALRHAAVAASEGTTGGCELPVDHPRGAATAAANNNNNNNNQQQQLPPPVMSPAEAAFDRAMKIAGKSGSAPIGLVNCLLWSRRPVEASAFLRNLTDTTIERSKARYRETEAKAYILANSGDIIMPETEDAEAEAVNLLIDPAPFLGLALATLDVATAAVGSDTELLIARDISSAASDSGDPSNSSSAADHEDQSNEATMRFSPAVLLDSARKSLNAALSASQAQEAAHGWGGGGGRGVERFMASWHKMKACPLLDWRLDDKAQFTLDLRQRAARSGNTTFAEAVQPHPTFLLPAEAKELVTVDKKAPPSSMYRWIGKRLEGHVVVTA